MASSLLDKRGRTTVPARIRSALDLRPGTRLRWHVTPAGVVLVRPKTKSITDIAGFLQPNSPDTVIDVDEMNPSAAADDFGSTAVQRREIFLTMLAAPMRSGIDPSRACPTRRLA